MAGRSRILKVEIVGDARHLGRTFDEANRKAGKLSGTFAKLGGVAGGVLAGGALLAGASGSLALAAT